MVLPKLVTREMVLFPMWPSLKTDSVKYHPLCSYRCKQMFSLLPISSSLTYLSPFFVNLSFSLFLILSLILSLYPWLKVCEESRHRLTSLSPIVVENTRLNSGEDDRWDWHLMNAPGFELQEDFILKIVFTWVMQCVLLSSRVKVRNRRSGIQAPQNGSPLCWGTYLYQHFCLL